MSDLIANWIRPGSFVIFHYFNRNWNCCDYKVLLSRAFLCAKSLLILIHVPCRNSLAMLFYAIFINKQHTLQKRNFHVRTHLFTILSIFIQINHYLLYYKFNCTFTSLSLERRIIEKPKEMW